MFDCHKCPVKLPQATKNADSSLVIVLHFSAHVSLLTASLRLNLSKFLVLAKSTSGQGLSRRLSLVHASTVLCSFLARRQPTRNSHNKPLQTIQRCSKTLKMKSLLLPPNYEHTHRPTHIHLYIFIQKCTLLCYTYNRETNKKLLL